MKVFLPAISGLVPTSMVEAIAALTKFCYILRWDVLDEEDLEGAQEVLNKFARL